MKPILLALLLLFAFNVAAQSPATDKLHLIGEHMEKDGKRRTTALAISLGTSFVALAAIATADGEDMPILAGTAIAAIGGAIAIVLNFSASGHAKKAGRLMREL